MYGPDQDEAALRGCACAFRVYSAQQVCDFLPLISESQDIETSFRRRRGNGCAGAGNGCAIDARLLHAALDEDDSNDRPAELGVTDSLWVTTQKLLLK
eukprot:COSAG03_NODE_1237_length_4498_cov_16.580132_5_plen_98_part_00